MRSRKSGQVNSLSLGWLLGEQEVFELKWRAVAQSGVKALGVVKGLDIIKEHGLSVLEVKRDLMSKTLGFECGPEAFHSGIVV
jgi:hypothetical protein